MEHIEAYDAIRNAIGVMQHHDAVTGTEKQLVADDYADIMFDAMTKVSK